VTEPYGATPVEVHGDARQDHKVTPETLDAHTTARTKLLIFSSPGNPAGTVEPAGFLLDEAGVAVVPGKAFGAPGSLRLSYALDEQSLLTALPTVGSI
jgi:aspartate/methionine/tyrosine aminotransferase